MRFLLVFAGAPFLLGLIPVTAAIPTISAIGSKFFDSNGNQFFIKGILNCSLRFQYHMFDSNFLFLLTSEIGLLYLIP
jgi:hypothetical protein